MSNHNKQTHYHHHTHNHMKLIPLEFSSECLRINHSVHSYFFLDSTTPSTNCNSSSPIYLQILSVLPSYLDNLPSSLKITGILFETHSRSVVFSCEPIGLCLKLIRSRRVFNTERLAYEQLQGQALELFLPLLFFCKVSSPLFHSNQYYHKKPRAIHWKGYCMKQGQYSIRDILFKPPRQSDANHQAMLQQLLLDKNRFLSHTATSSSSSSSTYQHFEADIQESKTKRIKLESQSESQSEIMDPHLHQDKLILESKILITQAEAEERKKKQIIGIGGILVSFKHSQTVQLSLCLTVLRLLHALHQSGWVHGDSHMGNFVYTEGRLYAIDFERSFCSKDPIQHFLDIQEAFGHFSTILVHPERQYEWDMKDILGIYFHRHPLFTQKTTRVGLLSPIQRRMGNIPLPKRMTLYMLPICTCFTCPKQAIRVKGCSMCNTEFNRLSAHLFSKRSNEVLADLEVWGLNRLKESLMQTRNECIRRCNYVANIIYPCISDGLALSSPLPLHSTDISLHLPIKDLTTNLSTCLIALKRLLYAPSLNSHSMAMTRLLCDRLHASGHTEAARIVWLYTAWDSSLFQSGLLPPPSTSSSSSHHLMIESKKIETTTTLQQIESEEGI